MCSIESSINNDQEKQKILGVINFVDGTKEEIIAYTFLNGRKCIIFRTEFAVYTCEENLEKFESFCPSKNDYIIKKDYRFFRYGIETEKIKNIEIFKND